MIWVQFLMSALVIIVAGARLTVYADKLSEHLNLGKAFIGVILLGLITSLPEAVTCIVSVVSLKANDLAVGNLLGSNNFNPMLIVVMDMLYRKGSISSIIHPNASQNTSAWLAIFLTTLVIAEISIDSSLLPHVGNISMGSVLICVFYFLGIRQLSKTGFVNAADAIDIEKKNSSVGLSTIWINVFASAVVVILGAIFLANICDRIAVDTGWGQTFVGSSLLALVTSLPEIVVSVSAFRLGQPDLAIGNIFGSNMSNMFLLFVTSLFAVPEPLLFTVSPVHVFTAWVSIILTFAALRGIRIKEEKVFWGLGLNSAMMIAIFLIGATILYQLS